MAGKKRTFSDMRKLRICKPRPIIISSAWSSDWTNKTPWTFDEKPVGYFSFHNNTSESLYWYRLYLGPWLLMLAVYRGKQMNTRFTNYLTSVAKQTGPNSVTWAKNTKKVRNAVVTEVYNQGYSVDIIADIMNLSNAQIRGMLVRNGVYKGTAKKIADEEFGEQDAS